MKTGAFALIEQFVPRPGDAEPQFETGGRAVGEGRLAEAEVVYHGGRQVAVLYLDVATAEQQSPDHPVKT